MPTPNTKDYNIRIRQRGAEQVERTMSRLGRVFTRVFTAGAVLEGIKQVVAASTEQETIFRKLQTAVELTGENYADLSGNINNTFAELQRLTEFGDTDSAQVLTTLVQLTGDFDKAMAVLPLTLDLAATGLMDSGTAARNIALALGGNIEMLGRYIPELRTSTNEQLKSATSSRKAAIALETLSEKFSGTAIENVKTTAGAFTQLGNSIGDLAEKIGDTLLPPLEKAARFLTDLVNAANTYTGADFVRQMMSSTEGFTETTKTATEETRKLSDAITVTSNTALTNLIDNLKNTTGAWESLVAEGMEPAVILMDEIPTKMKEVEGVNLDFTVTAISGWDVLRNKMTQFTGTMESSLLNALKTGENVFKAFGDAFVDMLARMAAELAARAAIFGLISLIPGAGAVLGVGSLSSFLFGGGFGGPGVTTSRANGIGGPQQLGTGGTNVFINAIDASSFESYLRFRGGARAIQRTLPEVIS